MWDSSTSALKPREFSWVGPFSMLYIDSPVGVGFSFSDSGDQGLRVTREEYTADLYKALCQFYKMFPQFNELELYLGGQSYAGRYVPALAQKVHEMNKKEDCRHQLPLAGIYLGGPSVSFELQTPADYDFAYNMGFQNKGYLDERLNNFTELMGQVNAGNGIPMEIFSYISQNFGFIMNDNFNDPVIPDIEVEMILAHDYIKKAMHVRDMKFKTYNYDLAGNYLADMFVTSNTDLAAALENYKVLIYNGNYDATVSTSSVDAVLVGIEWSGKEEYKLSKRSNWKPEHGRVKGYVSQTGNLCRVVVHRAGHQTPHDQPQNVLEMMEQFVQQGCVKP